MTMSTKFWTDTVFVPACKATKPRFDTKQVH